MSQEPKKAQADETRAGAPRTTGAVHAAGHAGEADELIVVPKGRNRARFVMTFLLVIMLLTTFTVGDEVVQALTGQGRGTGAFMTWEHPSAGKQRVSMADFLTEKQNLNKLWEIAVGGRSPDRSDEDTAYYILLDALAEDAGVRVTDKELQEFIQPRFQSAEQYRNALAAYRMSPKDFERTLRGFLRVNRYQNLLATSLAIADPAELEKRWKANHQEHAFDYVELPVEALKSEAEKQAPPSAELEAWFTALPETERETYRTKPKVSGEIAVFPVADEAASARASELLLAKFPLLPDANLDQVARDYYDGFRYVRFRNRDFRPTGQQLNPEDLYLAYDKVEAEAKREAPMYRALSTWLADLSARADRGEAVDLAAEAAALGLEYHAETDPSTAEEWEKIGEAKPAIGRYVVESMLGNGVDGKYLPAVAVDEKGLAVARVIVKRDAATPQFAEIEGKVREAWVKKKAGELAVQKLEALRDAFGTRPAAEDTSAPPFRPESDTEKFMSAVKAAGYESVRHEFAERSAKMGDLTPFETYLRQSPPMYTLKENTVAKAELSSDGERAYLVRVAGIRDADPSKMTPADVQNLSRQIAQQAMDTFRSKTFRSAEFMKERYALDLETWHRDSTKAN